MEAMLPEAVVVVEEVATVAGVVVAVVEGGVRGGGLIKTDW